MLVRVLVCSFYTKSYEDDAAKLKASLEELCVPHRVVPVTLSDTSWKAAVCHKIPFIAQELCALSAEFDGLVWTDADSILRRPMPVEQLEACDFGMARFAWSKAHTPELLSGTMFFRRCPVVYSFVNEWLKVLPKYRHTDTPEQRSVEEVLEKFKDRLKFETLSTEWCSIFDAPHAKGHRAVFSHFQSSRTKRR